MTLVRDVMSKKVITMKPEQSVAEAADVLAQNKIGAVPVVDESGSVIGLLDDDDLLISEARVHVPTVIPFLTGDLVLPGSLHRFDAELRKAAGATVADVMDEDFAQVSPNDSVETAATIMHDRGQTHIPVVEDSQLVGVVTRGDLVRHLAAST